MALNYVCNWAKGYPRRILRVLLVIMKSPVVGIKLGFESRDNIQYHSCGTWSSVRLGFRDPTPLAHVRWLAGQVFLEVEGISWLGCASMRCRFVFQLQQKHR